MSEALGPVARRGRCARQAKGFAEARSGQGPEAPLARADAGSRAVGRRAPFLAQAVRVVGVLPIPGLSWRCEVGRRGRGLGWPWVCVLRPTVVLAQPGVQRTGFASLRSARQPLMLTLGRQREGKI